MMNFPSLKVSITLFIFCLASHIIAQDGTVKQTKLTDFQLQSSALIDADGQTISNVSYESPVYWFPVKVPCTVLTGLVANRIYPDPYSGLNNMLIPDASDAFNKEYSLEQYSFLPNDPNPWKKPYWYRTTFSVPLTDKGRHFQLIFKGINYRAAVWVNGHQIADSTQMAGMFAEYSLDVSKAIHAGQDNALAVKIYPLDYPGLPAKEQLKAMGPFYENAGPTADIGKNVTMLCSVGWNWIPPVRDRNMGIWLPVFLRTTGGVTISYPHLITTLPLLPDTTSADLSLSLKIINSQQVDAQGKLVVTITPENFVGESVSFSKDIALKANQNKTVSFDPANEPLMQFKNPHLWWSIDHGKPNLYRMRLQYKLDNQVSEDTIAVDQISDDTTFVFGIRTVSSKFVEIPGKYPRRDFYVNGKRVNLVGGAWVPDMMLNRDSARYSNELLLCRNANANLIRIWGGGITPPDAFFDACDRYGLLVWSDFWITRNTQGQANGSPNWPLEKNVFIQNMTSTISRIRNHPSLLVWTGGNEGLAGKILYDAMRDSVISMDGTRDFLPCTSGDAKLPDGWKASWPDNKIAGVYSSGPYYWKDPKVLYDLADHAKDWVFKDETGIPSQPPYNSLIKIIPNLVWDKKDSFPMNDSWGYHDACGDNAHYYDRYYNDMTKRFGKAKSMIDFSVKMQLMNAMGYQAIFEAAGHKLNDNGGMMLWKLNAAFPSVIWQIYDWYLEPNAGYYFMQNACESSHVQFNRDDSTVAVVNRSYSPLQKVTVEADGYDLQSKKIFHQNETTPVNATEVHTAFNLSDKLSKIKGVTFLLLTMKDASGTILSNNSYWLAPKQDFTAMAAMPKTQVTLKMKQTQADKSSRKWTFQLTNPTDQVAFFVRLQLMNQGEEILPTFWSSNYITLAPHEIRTVSVDVPLSVLRGNNASVQIEGWNLNTQTKTQLTY